MTHRSSESVQLEPSVLLGDYVLHDRADPVIPELGVAW